MWHDKWHEILLADRFACLFSFVINEDCSVAEFYATNDWSGMYHNPLSPEAFEELQLVLYFKPESLNQSHAADSWIYVWGQAYFPKKFYEHCHKDIVAPPPFAWIWKSKLHMKIKVFMWFLLADRLNTRNMLRRRHFNINKDSTASFVALGWKKPLSI